MAGNIKVGGHTVFSHTGPNGSGTLTIQGQNGNVFLSDDGSGAVALGTGVDIRNANGGIPSGSVMLFRQTNAPVGFTKLLTDDDSTLRVTSGTVGTGGSLGFTSVFSRTSTDGHSLSESEIPSHNHDVTHKDIIVRTGVSLNDPWDVGLMSTNAAAWSGSSANPFTSDNTGSGNSHSHDMDIRVKYVDIIIATKD